MLSAREIIPRRHWADDKRGNLAHQVDEIERKRRGRLGWYYKLGALIAAAMGILLATQGLPQWIGVPLFGLLIYLASRWFKRGKQFHAKSAEQVLSDDKRSPILYLRSFVADSAETMSFGALTISVTTAEEQLAKAMNELGPFVAIGRPGELLPQLGAFRTYVSHADWQERVSEMMQKARLIVLLAGNTEGFWWEVQHASKNIDPQKLALLLPFNREKYNAFRVKAEQFIPSRLPDYPMGKRREIFNVVGRVKEVEDLETFGHVLRFGSDWSPQIASLKWPFYTFWPSGLYRVFAPPPYTLALKRALSPMIKAIGLRWRRSPALIWPLTVAILGLPFVVPIIALSLLSNSSPSLSTDPHVRATANVRRGDELWQMGTIEQAEEAYKTAAFYDSKSGAIERLCTMFVRYKDEFFADSYCRQAVSIAPEDANMHYLYAKILSHKSFAQKEAIAEYVNAEKIAPNNAEIHNDLCVAYANNEEWKKAERECRQAVELAPNDPTMRNNLHEIRLRLKHGGQ